MHIGLRCGGKELRALSGQRGEIKAGTGDEILGLTNVHPEALQVKGVQLAVLDNGGESLLLNGCGTEFDALEHRRIEDVDTGIDTVSNEFYRLLDEAVDSRWMVWLVHHNTIFRGLLDLCDDNRTLLAVLLMELGELLEGVFASYVGIQDEEWRFILA